MVATGTSFTGDGTTTTGSSWGNDDTSGPNGPNSNYYAAIEPLIEYCDDVIATILNDLYNKASWVFYRFITPRSTLPVYRPRSRRISIRGPPLRITTMRR